ncbi:hypothetical protein KIN20_008551 [Parelaphostrongylus tenuis]|uniref:Uncharacterized protein n=1 Tax=Parelaphostrongylus tenuis TaxID=148309 RepID=A0AAD5QMR3_PARTN|nr:hypothetical protein KIN20_008551 [Parelaphostrongylus tenuis]
MRSDQRSDIKAEPEHLTDEEEKKHARGKTFPVKRKWNSTVVPSRPGGNDCGDSVHIEAGRLAKHDTGASALNPENMRSEFHRKQFALKKTKLVQRCIKTARAEILNKEEEGFIEGEDGEPTYVIKQREIAEAVDLGNANKYFELYMENYGPYRISYTDNGRHLLLGGKKRSYSSTRLANEETSLRDQCDGNCARCSMAALGEYLCCGTTTLHILPPTTLSFSSKFG